MNLIIALFVTSHLHPVMPLDELRTEYVKNNDKLMHALYHNAFIHERSLTDGHRFSLARISFGDYVCIIGSYEPGHPIVSGEYLSPTSFLKVGYLRDESKSKLISYTKVDPAIHDNIRKTLTINGFHYLHSLNGYDISIMKILNGPPPGEVQWPPPLFKIRAVHAEHHTIQGRKVIRLYFTFSNTADNKDYPTQLFGTIPAHGYIDLSPEDSYIVVAGAKMGGNTWTNEFDGTINGIPRLKKVTNRYKSSDPNVPDRVITVEMVKYEPTTSIDTSLFEPRYFGIDASLDDPMTSSSPSYILFAIAAGLVCVIFGMILYRLSHRVEVTAQKPVG